MAGLPGLSGVSGPASFGRMMTVRVEYLRGRQTRRRFDGDRVASPESARVVAPDTRRGSWPRSSVSVTHRTPPRRTSDAADEEVRRHRSGHFESVLLAHPAGHRGRRAARGLLGAARRHAARRAARGTLRAHAAPQGSRWPDLSRSSSAEGSGGAGAVDPPGRAPIVNGCEFSPRLGIPSVHIDNATAASDAMDHLYRLGHRRIGIVTGPLVSPLSRDRLRGATSRAKKPAPSATSS